MSWRGRTPLWIRTIALISVIVFLSAGGLYISLIRVYSSELPTVVEVEPRKAIRGFIALPSADTIQIQNVYSTSTQIDLRFVGPGSPTEPISDTLPAGRGRIYAKPPNFSGFASIDADLQVQAVNFDLRESGSHAYLGLQLDGIAGRSFAPGPTSRSITEPPSPRQITGATPKISGCLPGTFTYDIPIPLLMKEYAGWTTRFSIQNPGFSDANVAIQFCNAAGEVVHSDFNAIASGGSFSVDLAGTPLPSDFFGNAMVTSDQVINVASSVEMYNDELSLRSAYRVERTEGQRLVAAALFKNADRQNSQICVQNGNDSDRSFSIAYTDSVTVDQTIPAGQTTCFYQKDEAHADGWIGGAVITSDSYGLLSAVVLVDATDQDKLVGRWVYTVTPKERVDAQKGLAFPLLYNDHQELTTSIHLTNYGTQAATVTPSYTAQSGFSPCAQPFTLAPGETRTLIQSDLPAQFDMGSAYFTSTLPVAAVVSATNVGPLGATDRHFGYSAAYLETLGTSPATCAAGGFTGYRPMDEQFWSYQRGYYMEVSAPEMWEAGLTGVTASNPVTVAVIDTGVDLDHPDLAANLVQGYDFVEEDMQPQDTSEDSHGTKVAGVIAAHMNNDLAADKARGVVGIGGGNSLGNPMGLRIMPLRVAAESSTSDLCAVSARAIDYAVTHGARIINISYGSTDQCADELAAVQRAYAAGVVIVAGAGNDHSATAFYPAAYGTGENENLVLAVAGLDPGGNKAYASNYGTWIDLAAPYQVRSLTKDGGYASDSGTSFSAPFVSGLLGIFMSNFNLSGVEAVQTLRTTADNVDGANPAQYHGQLGAGRINAARASQSHLSHTFLPFVMSSGE